ncbi:MAG TPA: sugar kinase [Silvibacterium sp.]|nr:sugar kinase [Silvibacterium sp.]
MSRFDVTLVGEANLDLVLYGLPGDLPSDRELVADGMALTLGGSPAITANNLAILGSRTGFITAASNDIFGSMCLGDLGAAGVDLSRAVSKNDGRGTGVSVLLQHRNSRHTLTYSGNSLDLRWEDLDLNYLTSAGHFHLSSYFLQKGLREDIPRLFSHVKQAGLTISMDPNDDPVGLWDDSFFESLRYADVFMPNEREVCEMMREADAERAIGRLSELVPLLVVKRGARGALAIESGRRCEAEAFAVTSVDAVGAGDSFNAGFLHGFVKGWPLDRCLRFGNLTGAFSTTAPGGVQAFRDRAALEGFLAAHMTLDTEVSGIQANQ